MREHYRREMREVLAEWTRSHHSLEHEDPLLGLGAVDSAPIAALYKRLGASFMAMEAAAHRLIRCDQAGDTAAAASELRALLAAEPDFLTGMNDIVYQLQREAESRVAGVRRIELGLLSLVLLTLLLEGLFVFRPAVRSLARDLAARRRLEREILEISERERERIGQDIHDGICQQIAGIRLVAESMVVRAARDGSVDLDAARTITDLSERALSTASALARGMYIMSLTERGLCAALADLALETGTRTPVTCTCDLEIDELHIPREAALQLYRIAQEALTNAQKHAAATRVHLTLRSQQDEVILHVTDDGVGVAEDAQPMGGMGLHIMQYRARSIGATLELERAGAGRPGRGTRVTCRLPSARAA